MPVKDRIVTWFIKNILVPRREIIDQPGFIVNTFTDKHKTTYLRELFLPERLFELIENKVVDCYGDQGKQALYSAGKKFGYLYSSMSNFPTVLNTSKEDLLDFAYFFVRFVECTFARQADHEIDLENKSFHIFLNDFVICRHNGLGYFMADGGIAGIWAYVVQDVSVEGKQLECRGRGFQKCHIYCAPEENIKLITSEYFREKDMPVFKFDNLYRQMNEIRQTTYACNSLKQLLDGGFFSYVEGNLSYKTMRFFSCESHALYVLEEEITKLPNGNQFLFEASFEYGQLLQKLYGYADYQNFIADFFPAIGFGDIWVGTPSTGRVEILFDFYPWTIFSDRSRYVVIRGILSGFISECTNKKILMSYYS
ncbi:MAG: hypothetical protein QXS02_03190 [Candidatus Thermoplasmatota archaeon]